MMNKGHILATVLTILACGIGQFRLQAQTRPTTQPKDAWRQGPRVSPFQAVRFGAMGTPEVKVNGVWYELVAMDNVPADQIVSACQLIDPRDWQKRFSEDLIGILIQTVGRDPKSMSANLKVKDLQSGEEEMLEKVPMTDENRRAAIQARMQAEKESANSARQPAP